MKFQKQITVEEQLFLNKILEKYEQEKQMSKSERTALHSWVASGNDPYINGYGYCFENGHQMDFVEAERTCLELYEQNKITSS